MKQQFRLFVVTLCAALLGLSLASNAMAQCQADGVHSYSNDDLNEFGLLMQAARSADVNCRIEAHDKLRDKLASIRMGDPNGYWSQWLIGGYLSMAIGAAMELAGNNTFSSQLDYEIYQATTHFSASGTGAPGDPCGLAGNDPYIPGKLLWRRANSCMDDHTLAAQGWAWITAYYRQSGRSWQTARANAISEIHNSFSPYDSVCVFNASQYNSDSMNGTVEANPCNRAISALETDPNNTQILSLNHGNEAINYGFGLLSSISAAFYALDIANAPVNIWTELTDDDRRVVKYLWKEAAVGTTSTGEFHRTADGNANCWNMANPLTGTRVLQYPWGCQDEGFAEGDTTEDPTSGPNYGLTDKVGPRGYKAKFFPLARFYEKYGFTKGDGSGNGYGFDQFSEDAYGNTTFYNYTDPGEPGTFFGPGRQEVYREMAWKWLDWAPALTAGSEFRVAIGTYSGYYFQATNGGGSTLYGTGTNPNDAYSTLYIYDLNGAHLRGGDPVAVAVKSGSTTYYMSAEGGGGGVVNINRIFSDPTQVGPWERFTIERVSGGANDMISNGEQFALKASNGQYVTAEGGGGGAINANRSVRDVWETFTFVKTEP